jgi:hypothetical protein
MTDERRPSKRVPTSIAVVWEGATGRYEARTIDVSMSGCFIDTIGQVRVGETIMFKLLEPSGESIELQGEVVYEHPNIGFGIRFTNVDESTAKRLESLVKTEAEKQG